MNWSSVTSSSVFSGMLLTVSLMSSYCLQILGHKQKSSGLCREDEEVFHLPLCYPLFSCRFSSILKTMILFLSISTRSHRSSFSLPAHRQNMERGTVTRMEAISLHRLLMASILCRSEMPVRRVGPRREEKVREGRNSSNLSEDLQRVFLAKESDDLLHGCLVKQVAVFLINVQIPKGTKQQ